MPKKKKKKKKDFLAKIGWSYISLNLNDHFQLKTGTGHDFLLSKKTC